VKVFVTNESIAKFYRLIMMMSIYDESIVQIILSVNIDNEGIAYPYALNVKY
jgi:hypothetical protein